MLRDLTRPLESKTLRMLKFLIFLFSLLLYIPSINAQNLFFIGEKSFPATQSFSLKSNASDLHRDDLKLLVIKDGTNGSIVASRISYAKTAFSGSFIVYLKNGVVVKFDNSKMSDYVDDYTKAVYALTNEQLEELKNSDIHTVRYTLKCNPCRVGSSPTEEGTWTASNKETPTSQYISAFFGPTKEILKKKEVEIDEKAHAESINPTKEGEEQTALETLESGGDPYANVFYDSKDGKGSSMGYGLSGRTLKDRTVVQPACNRTGRVVVRVVVDQKGKVIDALPGVKGTTNKSRCLLEPAQKTALLYLWNADPKAPSLQIGFVVVEF